MQQGLVVEDAESSLVPFAGGGVTPEVKLPKDRQRPRREGPGALDPEEVQVAVLTRSPTQVLQEPELFLRP